MNSPSKKLGSNKKIVSSEEKFVALLSANSDIIYNMSSDWQIMQQLNGRGSLTDIAEPSAHWQENNLLAEDRVYITAQIEKAIKKKSVFQLEHLLNV